MKPRKREVEIFNMSLLDILCGALGAFCFMMLALFPDYVHARKSGVKSDVELKQDEKKKEKWKQVKRNVDQGMVAIRWDSPHDVDLYIQRSDNPPWGPKRIGKMTEEDLDKQDTRGGGSESRVFLLRGNVRVLYRLASTNGATGKATVYGFVSARAGMFTDSAMASTALPVVELSSEGETVAADLDLSRLSPDQIVFRRVGM